MRKLLNRFWDRPDGSFLSSAAILSALFLCGVVAGTVVCSNLGSNSGIGEYLDGYVALSSAKTDTGSLIGYAFFNAFKYHALIVIFGFSALGVVIVPVIVAVRGFFLSFAITSFIKVFGGNGFALALSALGAQSLIALPCLLILASQAFSMSASIMSSGLGNKKASTLLTSSVAARIGVCFAALAVSALIEAFLTPLLISTVAGTIS